MMQHIPKKALIIGCGLTGPALALFLKRAGIESEIYEARTTPEGYALSLASNGIAVLKMLSLHAAVMAEGSPITRAVMKNGKGRQLAEMSLAGAEEKSIFIKRVPLGQIISDEAERQGIKILRGKKLQAIEQAAQGGVIATFQDGTQARGDLLIGCDGVHSRTRQLIHPTFPGAVSTGLMNIGGYTYNLDLAPTDHTFHFVFGKQAFFGYHILASKEIDWFVNYPTDPARDTRDTPTRVSPEEQKRHLLTLFSADQAYIRDIIQTAETIIPEFPTYILPKPPAWHQGSVGLAGDAAHAISSSSGQGASMALEDAAVLAKCLRDIPETEQAFETYEQIRRERTQKMLKQGIYGDAGKHVSGTLKTWWRDQMTAIFLTFFGSQKSVRWIYDYKIDWDTSLAEHIPNSTNQQETTTATK
jgi:2-polyprenyl-6-methoxyphenol hydroxylase-like FAD-dependent oxidoreductase